MARATDPTLSKLNMFGDRVLRKFKEINFGGCCVFAALVAHHLSYQVSNVRIRASWQEVDHVDDGWDLDRIRPMVENNNVIQDWERNGVIIGHAVVEFDYKGKTWHYDTLGVRPAADRDRLTRWSFYKGYFTVDEAIAFAADDNWNPRFNRDNIPALEIMVDKFFETFNIKSTHAGPCSGAGSEAVRPAKSGRRRSQRIGVGLGDENQAVTSP